MKPVFIISAGLFGCVLITSSIAERLPYLRHDEDPFKLEYEAAGEFDQLYLLDSAREAELQQDWSRALYLFKELHRMDNTNPDHLFSMARMSYLLYQGEEALEYAGKLPTGYYTRDVTLLKAGCLLQLGRYEEAVSMFQVILEQESRFLAVQRGMAEALLALQRYEEAAGVFKAMLEIDPRSLDEHPDLKSALLTPTRRGPESWAHILKVYAQSKTLSSLYSPVDAATLSFQHVDREKAIELLVKAVEENPESAVLHSRLGLFYHYLGNTDLAKLHMERAAELSPDDLDVINNRGVLAMQLGDDDQAIEFFKRAVELRPDYAEAFRNLARMYYLKEEWSDSAYAAQQSLVLDQKSLDAALLIGFSFYKQKQYTDALRYIEPVLTDHLDRPAVWFLAGISAHQLGRWPVAERYYRKGLSLMNDYVLGLNNLADLLVNNPNSDADDIREALALAERASELTQRSVTRIESTLSQVKERAAAMGISD